MKIKLIALVLSVTVLFVSGCISISYPETHDKNFPPDGRYEILGPISAKGTTEIFIGLFSFGGIQYIDLLNEAEKLYKPQGFFDVVNVSVDKEFVALSFGIVTKIHTTLRGTAIRYIDAPAAAGE